MKVLFTLIIAIGFHTHLHGQLFGEKDFAIQQGFMNFHARSLNNDKKVNSEASMVNEFDRHFKLSAMAGLNYGIGMGYSVNAHKELHPFMHSQFFRVKMGLVLHLPQNHSARNWSPNKFNPFLKAGYNLDLMDNQYKEINKGRLSSSLRLGGGFVIKISHSLGLIYEFTHNQRVNKDYRTFYQNTFGIILNLDIPYQPY